MHFLSQFLLTACFVFLLNQKNIQQENTNKNRDLPAPRSTSILFVGNSLIYTNDLPSLVKQCVKEKGHYITTESLAFANYSLEDHWIDGELQKLIKEKKFDF